MTTSKFSQAFVEVRAALYVPEGSPQYAELLDTLRDTLAYQLGVRDTLAKKRQVQAKAKLREVANADANKSRTTVIARLIKKSSSFIVEAMAVGVNPTALGGGVR